jgi:hypothetical protein
MTRNASFLALALLGACAAPPTPQAVAPSLPPAAWHQITVLDEGRGVAEFPHNPNPGCCRGNHPTSPCVIDVQAALKHTPEAREFRARGFSQDSAEYHLLLHRANERLRQAIRRVSARHGYDLVMERGSVVLRPDASDVAVADITLEVAHEAVR